jgi:hypothetical protein
MMAEENKFILDIDVAPLKTQLKSATAELQKARQKFGEFSKEAIEAGQRVGAIKDELEGAAESAALFDPGKKFQALTTAASQAAAGVAAVQGAFALFGSESENVQKALLKVQGALALSQGLSELKDIGKSFGQIKLSIKAATTGLNGFKKALVSTGIGALVVAVGLLVAYWDDIKGAVNGVSAEQDKLNKQAEENLKVQEGKLEALESSDEILKSEGKTEREILDLKIKQTEQVVAAQELQLEQSKATQKAQIEAAKRNKKILEGLITAVTVPIQLILKSIDAIGSAFGKDFGLQEKFTEGLAELVFDPEQVEKDGIAANAEMEKQLLASKNKLAGYKNQVKAIDKKASDDAIAKGKENADKQKQLDDEANKIIADARKSQLKDQQRELAELEEKYQDERKKLVLAGNKNIQEFDDIYKKNKEAVEDKYKKEQADKERAFQNELLAITEAVRIAGIKDEGQQQIEQIKSNYASQLQAIEESEEYNAEQKLALRKALIQQEEQEIKAVENNIELERLNGEIEKAEKEKEKFQLDFDNQRNAVDTKQALLQEQFDKGLISEKDYNAQVDALSKERIAIAEAEQAEKERIQQAGFDLAAQFGGVLQQMAGKNKAVAIAGIVIEQAAAIAKIIANTATANAKAVNASFVTGGMPWVAINTASAALSIASTIANAKKSIQAIKQGGQNPTSGGTLPTTGGGASSAPQMGGSLPTLGEAPVTALNAITQQNRAPIRAFVVESEVTSVQNRVSDIERRAGF